MNNALKSHADIVAEMESGPIPEHRHDREILRYYAHSLDLAHKRDMDALKQRCAELNAEIAAKDEVIKRLNDAIAEEQRRQMATTEKSSVVGDAAKLPKTVDLRFDICQNIELVLKIGRDYQNKDGYRGAHYDTVKLLCDAIEYQQEQLKTKTEVGDYAKLREALEELMKFTCNSCERRLCEDDAEEEDAQIVPSPCSAIIGARNALAAPPRNCDIYLTEEAVDAATATVRDCGACSRIDMEAPCVFCMVRWLLAPAKEGGRDGGK